MLVASLWLYLVNAMQSSPACDTEFSFRILKLNRGDVGS